MTPTFAAPDTRAIPVRTVTTQGFDDWLASQDVPVRDWVRANGFIGTAG